MNNACPQCGAVYNVTPRDIGRRIACKKCRAPLTVAEEGIIVEAESLSTGEDVAEPFSPRSRQHGSPFRRLTALVDVPTLLFGLGMFLVIVFAFLPAIDFANAQRQKEAVTQGDLEDQLDQLEVDQIENASARSTAEKGRKERAEDWQDRKAVLQLEAQLAEVNARRALVWNQRGLLLGFVLLSFAGIGFLTTEQPTWRKVLGGVLLLFIFLAVTGGGARVSVGDFGGPAGVPRVG